MTLKYKEMSLNVGHIRSLRGEKWTVMQMLQTQTAMKVSTANATF